MLNAAPSARGAYKRHSACHVSPTTHPSPSRQLERLASCHPLYDSALSGSAANVRDLFVLIAS
jgi:hypothetical protein